MEKSEMTEFVLVTQKMNEAGYTNVTADMIEKSKNKYGVLVYTAVVEDAMVIYTPEYKKKPVKFVCF